MKGRRPPIDEKESRTLVKFVRNRIGRAAMVIAGVLGVITISTGVVLESRANDLLIREANKEKYMNQVEVKMLQEVEQKIRDAINPNLIERLVHNFINDITWNPLRNKDKKDMEEKMENAAIQYTHQWIKKGFDENRFKLGIKNSSRPHLNPGNHVWALVYTDGHNVIPVAEFHVEVQLLVENGSGTEIIVVKEKSVQVSQEFEVKLMQLGFVGMALGEGDGDLAQLILNSPPSQAQHLFKVGIAKRFGEKAKEHIVGGARQTVEAGKGVVEGAGRLAGHGIEDAKEALKPVADKTDSLGTKAMRELKRIFGGG